MYRTCSSQSLCSLKTASIRGNGLRLTDLHTLFHVFLETRYLPYLCIFKILPCQLCGPIPRTLAEQTKDLHMKLLVFTVRGPDNLCGDFFFRTFLSAFPFLPSVIYQGALVELGTSSSPSSFSYFSPKAHKHRKGLFFFESASTEHLLLWGWGEGISIHCGITL